MNKPLRNRTIVVTRARGQASEFAARLRKLGATVILCPTIRIVAPRDFRPLAEAARRISGYDWLVFTSVNGVEFFMKCAQKIRGFRLPAGLKVCAIGPATAKRIRAFGLPVHRTSKDYVAESILEVLTRVKGKKILIPRAQVARDVLPRELKKRGAKVHLVAAYRTVIDRSGLPLFRKRLRSDKIDCITFTSSSTVNNFISVLSRTEKRQFVGSGRIQAASIGPITTDTLKSHGWVPSIVAAKPTTGHLERAIISHFRRYHEK